MDLYVCYGGAYGGYVLTALTFLYFMTTLRYIQLSTVCPAICDKKEDLKS
jgi:hypothetical protein